MTLLFDLLGNAGNYGLVKTLIPALMAILFLQSGLDKVFNYKGNLDYFTDHFKNSPLSKTVGLLMPTITILEVAAGIMCAVGTVSLFFGNEILAYIGLMLSGLSLLCLFFGQRLAKDYAGAGGLVGYFILVVIGLQILA
jgi:uncharacterized membrane protein YphA (DoxX/SURF4 family)